MANRHTSSIGDISDWSKETRNLQNNNTFNEESNLGSVVIRTIRQHRTPREEL